jgi:hypothetical protein
MTTLNLPEPLATTTQLACRLCGTASPLIFHQQILADWDAGYYQCPCCDLIQTDEPQWLSQAYTSAIAAMDTGVIERNRLTADLTSALAWILGVTPNSPCLDFGGGNGVFVRMMRDRGFNFRLSDRYAQNIFARGFEADAGHPVTLVTAFEVFEHLVDVSAELERLFTARPDALLVSTQLHRGHEPGWWYYSPETGQHVAFYSARTMRYIANRFGYVAAGARAYTLFIRSDAQIAPWRVRFAQFLTAKSKGNATNASVRALLKVGPTFPSRIQSDNQEMKLKRL